MGARTNRTRTAVPMQPSWAILFLKLTRDRDPGPASVPTVWPSGLFLSIAMSLLLVQLHKRADQMNCVSSMQVEVISDELICVLVCAPETAVPYERPSGLSCGQSDQERNWASRKGAKTPRKSYSILISYLCVTCEAGGGNETVVSYERRLWPEFVISCWLFVIGNRQSDRGRNDGFRCQVSGKPLTETRNLTPVSVQAE